MPGALIQRQPADLSTDHKASGLRVAGAAVGILPAAISLVQEVRKARESIKGASETITNITSQLNALDTTLSFVSEKEPLQTVSVGEQLHVIVEVGNELQRHLDNIRTEQQKKAVRHFFQPLTSGDKDDQKLAAILGRLNSARLELVLRISMTQFGLLGDLQYGFRIAFGVLQEETNKDVSQILGHDLALSVQIKDKQSQGGSVPQPIAAGRTRHANPE